MVQAIAIGALILTNLITAGVLIRVVWFERRVKQNEDQIRQWLMVSDDLKRAGNSAIEIRRMDADSIFYRQP